MGIGGRTSNAGTCNWEQEPSFGGKAHPQLGRPVAAISACFCVPSLRFCFKACLKIKHVVASLRNAA